jgi:SpoVK/Ycf46/Vps4 family AAA+-type ATPase
MDNLILHELTRGQLDQFAARPSHALLLIGPDGIGKTAIADALLSVVLALEEGKLTSHPYFLRIQSEGDSLSAAILYAVPCLSSTPKA